MRGMKVTYPNYLFWPKDFLTLENEEIKIGTRPFEGDIVALVTSDLDGIHVEIISIRGQNGQELLAFIRAESEYKIMPVLRSFYLNTVRRGFEGDVGA